MKKKIQKPFDAEAAKRGARVETKGGDPVRIICYDRKGDDCPILALVSKDKKYSVEETCTSYTLDGSLGYVNVANNEDLVIIEEVECPKFKKGDWLFRNVNGEWPLLITAVTTNCYEVQGSQRCKTYNYRATIDSNYHLWTLEDAKPGDVLIREDGKYPIIFQRSLGNAIFAYCGLSITDSILIDNGRPWTYDPVRPATYEERQQLFNMLKEEGYKWDAETLTVSKIQKRWRDNENVDVNGYYIDGDSSIVLAHSGYNGSRNHNVFATKKQAKAALAMARISQIMQNDERFGGVVTDDEWDSTVPYFVIAKVHNMLIITRSHRYEYLGFHTMEQANLFLQENEDLVKDYYMLD